MTSLQVDQTKPLPDGDSYWDKLPKELHDMVIGFSSPLTRLINDRLKVDKLDDKAKQQLWIEVFEADWNGDLSLLPNPPRFNNTILNRHLVHVKSRNMYDRLCERFPNSIETNQQFGEQDADVEAMVVKENSFNRNYDYISEPHRLLHIAMRHMWMDLLEKWIDEYPYAAANECIVEGHTELLKHLVDTKKVDLKRIFHVVSNYASTMPMDIAAISGRLDILKMFHEAGSNRISRNAMDCSAWNGHLDVVKWLHENRKEGCTKNAIDNAAECGHLHVIKFLHENRKEGCTKRALNRAAMKGHLETIKWLLANRRVRLTVEAMDLAAAHGHLNIVKWLHENRKEGCTTRAVDFSILNGEFRVAKWLLENRNEGYTVQAFQVPMNLDYITSRLILGQYPSKLRLN